MSEHVIFIFNLALCRIFCFIHFMVGETFRQNPYLAQLGFTIIFMS